mmetsp:Transcript_24990/g.48815  ORF Transcript_24990/g.48815 Transcript_24990/m.48815 type:complete len:217 (-) Transcript_24990:45-695(-)
MSTPEHPFLTFLLLTLGKLGDNALASPSLYLLAGQISPDEHHEAHPLLFSSPLVEPLAPEHAVHGLEGKLATHVLDGEDALGAEQAPAVFFKEIREKRVQLLQVKRARDFQRESAELLLSVRHRRPSLYLPQGPRLRRRPLVEGEGGWGRRGHGGAIRPLALLVCDVRQRELVESESADVNQPFEINLPIVRVDDRRSLVDGPQHSLHVLQLLFAD